jgi:MFS family permease
VSETGSPVPTAAERRRQILVPLIVGCAFFMEGLDSTMVAVSIPAMAKSLGESPLRLNLVITSYLLAAGKSVAVGRQV